MPDACPLPNQWPDPVNCTVALVCAVKVNPVAGSRSLALRSSAARPALKGGPLAAETVSDHGADAVEHATDADAEPVERPLRPARWRSVPRRFTVAAREQVIVPLTVAVPATRWTEPLPSTASVIVTGGGLTIWISPNSAAGDDHAGR